METFADEQKRIVTPREGQEDAPLLRPQLLDQFVGQETLREKLKVFLAAAKARKEPLDHILFHGPPGLGKTTLAGIIAREMGGDLRITTGPAIERPGDLAALLSNLQAGDVLFIDEIHRLSASVEEILYSSMEDFALDIMVGKGPMARSIRLALPPFTLVGATTRLGLLTSPLRARFGIVEQIALYSAEELAGIVQRGSETLGVSIDTAAAHELGRRSRGTPRVALRLLRRVRDVAEVGGRKSIDLPVTRAALEMLGVDGQGLDEGDRRLLFALIDLFGGGPVGLSTLAAALNEEQQTIEDIYEPFLIQNGFLERTPRGRKATVAAFSYLGKSVPTSFQQLGLFGDDGA